jgi:hypothetical protein
MAAKKKPAKKRASKKSSAKGRSSVESTLRAKAAQSGISYSTLKKVHTRGRAAYLSSGSRNVPMEAWAMGRVKSFIRGSRKHDTDLRKGGGSGKKTKKA